MEDAPGQATKEAIDQAAKGNLILGKFKSAEEVVPAYQALEQDHGRLGSEVGSLRKINERLVETLNQVTAGTNAGQPQGQPPAPTDYDALLAETTNAVESGDLSVGEGMRKVTEIAVQKTAALAKQTFTEMDSQRNAQAFLTQFQRDNPDYMDAVQSGELEAIKRANPMHDNLSAFYEWKAGRAQSAAEKAVQEAYQKGRTEMAELAKGADATTRVLGKAGSEARTTNTNTGPVTEAGKISGMVDVLKAVRAG